MWQPHPMMYKWHITFGSSWIGDAQVGQFLAYHTMRTRANIGYYLINWIYHDTCVVAHNYKYGLLSGKTNDIYYSCAWRQEKSRKTRKM